MTADRSETSPGPPAAPVGRGRPGRIGRSGQLGRLGAGGVALLLLAALLPYANSFGHEFVRDDEVVIRDNPQIRSVAGLLDGLTSNWWGESVQDGLWRPLVTASFAANHALSGLSTWSYTALDLALHAAVVLLLARLALLCGAGRAGALVAGLLFAVHPVHTEAVTAFVGRADTLAALCVLAALLAHRRAARGGAGARAVTLAATAAALLCKEQAVALLPLIPLMDVLLPAQDTAGRPVGPRRRLVRDYLPLLAVLLLYLAARFAVLGALGRDPETIHPAFNPLVSARPTGLGELRGASAAEAFWTPFAILAEAGRLLAWPARLSFDYSWRRIPLADGPGDARVLAGLALLASCTWLTLRTWRRLPAAAFGLLLLALPYAVTANVVFPTGTVFGERLLYLPSAGLLLALGALAGRVLERRADRHASRREERHMAVPRVLLAGVGLLVLLGAARTWARNPDWRDADSVTAAMARDTPESFLSHYARGVYLLLSEGGAESAPDADAATRARDHARRARALEHLEASLAILPEYEQANRALVTAAWGQGEAPRALPAYERLLRLAPDDPRVHQGFASALLEQAARAPDEAAALRARALEALDTAVRLDPQDVDTRSARASLLLEVPDRAADAVEDLRAVLRLAPARPDTDAIRREIERLAPAAGG
jgi:cytochrome c-type biogenesis protein CcmH/NrfG